VARSIGAYPGGVTDGWALSDVERYHFDLYGYVVRHGALSTAEVAALLAAVARLDVPAPGATVQSQRFTGFLERDQVFRDLLDHESILEPVLELCGPRARLDHAYGIIMGTDTSGLGLHGGGTPHDPAQFYEVRGGRMYNGLVGVQWALVDHVPGDGGFCCIPGSHRANFPLPDGAAPGLVVTVPLAAGDVLFFTEGLTHGTTTWRAGYDRLALFYKYAPGHASWGVQYSTTLRALAESGRLTARQARLMQIPAVHPHEPIRDRG
jgi:ectoine hydroxylase-related dioxygenase (phytanoyl-CoA dioxygenase family)